IGASYQPGTLLSRRFAPVLGRGGVRSLPKPERRSLPATRRASGNLFEGAVQGAHRSLLGRTGLRAGGKIPKASAGIASRPESGAGPVPLRQATGKIPGTRYVAILRGAWHGPDPP